MKKMSVADFFCGAGGFSEGFRQKGFNVIFALDNWKPACDTHELNHPKCKHAPMNILELDTPEKIDETVPDVDVLIGSPPCVAFSGSNKAGKADKSLGIQLIETYLRIVAWKKSKGQLKYWILENVPNSEKYIKDNYTWKELGLPGKGPNLEIPQRNIFNAADFGAPQARKRFVCGDYPPPEKSCKDESEWLTLEKIMENLPNPLINDMDSEIIDPVYNFRISSEKLTDHSYDSCIEDFEWKRAKRLKEDHGFMGKMAFPEKMDRPSRTVMATRSASTRESMILEAIDTNGNNIGYRLPTIREVATMMSFPITYQFEAGNESSKYRLVGNAVCPKMSGALAEAIAKKENMKLSKHFIQLPDTKPTFDLTGTKRISKKPNPRKHNAKFSTHIPYLKTRSFRVDLNNIESDFNNNRFRWSCALHQGTGKNAFRAEIGQQKVEALFKDVKKFGAFSDDVKRQFKDLNMTHSELQESYCLNGASKTINPEKALDNIKELVDKHFPEEKYLTTMVDNTDRTIKIKRDQIPLRIAAGLFACNRFVERLKG